jgi:hypothetical protein
MLLCPTMSLQDRVDHHKKRDFQELEAEILVLIEEAAATIFASFPDHFVLFGGSTLVLFHGSPRLSRGLDLLASSSKLPSSDSVEAVVRSTLQPIAETFGLGQLEFRKDADSPDFVRFWIIANQRALFSIDLTRIGGGALPNQVVKQIIANTPGKTVITVTPEYLLYQKCETFLVRRYIKARDAFDIHLLTTRGAKLDANLHARLEDFIVMNEFDSEAIDHRIESLTAKICTVELRPVLPPAVFDELAKQEFEPIRCSLRTILSHWIKESKR